MDLRSEPPDGIGSAARLDYRQPTRLQDVIVSLGQDIAQAYFYSFEIPVHVRWGYTNRVACGGDELRTI